MKYFWETISADMRELMTIFGESEIGRCFYLAGGTGLALQLGHRKSYDLDLFTPSEDVPSIRQRLIDAFRLYDPILSDASWGNLVIIVKGVKLGFYGYGFPLVVPLLTIDQLQVAGLEDIALMKLDALLSRASRKDFHDLYAICQRIPLKKLFDLASQKYPGTRDFEAQVVKRLVFFERADEEEAPPLLQNIPWERVKAFFRRQAIELGSSWFN